MRRHDTRHEEPRRYLLGRLEELERDRYEARLLEDEDLYEEVLAAESELIEEYARGELDRRDREAFDARHRGRDGMGERIAFARALAEHARQAAPSEARRAPRLLAWLPRPALRLAVAGALAVLVALTGWLGWRAVELGEQVETLQAERAAAGEREATVAELQRQLDEARRHGAAAAEAAQEPDADTGTDPPVSEAVAELASVRAHADRLAAELARLESQAAESEPLAVSYLLALATRSQDGVRELAVPRQAELVRLQLDTGGDEGYGSYRVRLLGATGELWSRTGARQVSSADGPVIEVTVPAEALAAGRHELLVEGLEGGQPAELLGAYEFDVVRR